MKYEQLLKYMKIIIETEKDNYIQTSTISLLEEQASELGYRQEFDRPSQYYAEGDESGAAIVIGILAGIATFVIGLIVANNSGMKSDIGSIIGVAVLLLLLSGFVGFILNLIISKIVESKTRREKQSRLDSEYRHELARYEDMVSSDNKRVANELAQKNYIQEQIRLLKELNEKTTNNLEEFYGHDIIDDRYRHDLVALCTMYQYLRAGQTYSLKRDNATGDPGAYNIYENAYLAGLVLKKLDDVLEKMDEIIENQREIVYQLRESNKQIKNLNTTIIQETSRIDRNVRKAISEHNAATQYCLESINNQIAYRNAIDGFIMMTS